MKAVVLLSGGVDSSVCLAIAVERFGASEVAALNIFYGQKHAKEQASAEAIAKHYGVTLYNKDMSAAFDLCTDHPLLQGGKDIIHESYADQLSKKPGTVDTYVPFRNGLMLSYATAIAYSLGAERIYYGAHADDAAGRAYPDCTPEFEQSMDNAIYFGSGEKIKLEAPLLYLNKAHVVKEGLCLGVPFQLTWSCYEGGELPCGTCGTCIDRQNAFKANGISDPVEYMAYPNLEGTIYIDPNKK